MTLSVRVRLALLYALCAPWDGLVLLLFVLLAPVLRFRFARRRGVLWAELDQRSWVCRHNPYSTTVGHVVLLQPTAKGTPIEDHELVHVRQFEAAVVAAWLMALVLTAAWAVQRLAWGAGICALLWPWWGYFGASTSAFLRAERPYLDNAFERHARAEVQLQVSSEKGVKLVARS
jgi:hypothetical protein